MSWDGLFTPDGAFWRVNRELLINLSGMRAVLLEVAHPLVAAGVAQHSHFREKGVGRLFRTIRSMTQIIYGGGQTSAQGLRHIHRCHRAVRGELHEAVGAYPAGTPYDAADPQLRLWVWATLADSIPLTYEMFVGPLNEDEKRSYYADSRRLAQFLGAPPELTPRSLDDFEAYMDEMFAGDRLTVGPDARDLVDALLHPPGLGPLARAWAFMGAGMLPPRLRREFGFEWDGKRERRLARLASAIRGVRRATPAALCVTPAALLAARRAARSTISASEAR